MATARHPLSPTPVACARRDQRPGDDPVEQIGLARLERDEPAEHVEEVQQVLGIFGEPAVGLDFFQRRGRPPVADHRLGAVAPAVAEPLVEHILAGNLVIPHRRRDIVDEALADDETPLGGVVIHGLGQRLGRAGNGAVCGNDRPLVRRQARRPFRPAGGRVDEALAVAMQPDHFAPERDGLVE